jgi:glucosamine-6-phosphate deaminase
MKLILRDNYDQVSDFAARYVKKRINGFNAGPDRFFTLGLPTGIHVEAIVFAYA